METSLFKTKNPLALFRYAYCDTGKKNYFELNMEARIATAKEKEHYVESDTA